MDSKNIQQINEALRNSFAAIKQDMLDLRSSINLQAHDTRELKQAYEALRGEAITSDKLNLVKIRIGELNESLKRIWSIEEQLKAMEDKIVSKAFVNQQVDGVSIKVADLRAKLESFAKSYVSEPQIKKLIEDMNKELNSLRSNIDEIKDIKDTIKQKTLEKIAFKLNGKVEELRSQFNTLSSDVRSGIEDIKNSQKSVVSEKQVNQLIQDINEEFDKVKEILHQNTNAIDQLRESSMNVESNVRSSFSRELERADSRIAMLHDEMSRMRTNAPVYSAPMQPSKKTKGKKEDSTSTLPVEMPSVPVKRPTKKTKWFANFLIAVSFISLLISIISFIVDNPAMSDQFAIVAVATFALGVFLRFVLAIRKRNRLDQD